MAQPRPADEHAHAPGIDDEWSESWGFDFAADDGTAGFVRLTAWPRRGTAWWWAYLVGPEVGLVVVRDHEVPAPHRPDVLEIRADSLWGELVCETPFEHWGIGMEAFGVSLDDDAPVTVHGDEIGDRVAVGLDLEWEVVSPVASSDPPGHHSDGYSQGGIVHGELLVGRERLAFAGRGIRDHSWGASGRRAGRRLTAMLGDDVAVDAFVDARGDASGWMWELGGEVVSVDAVLAEEQRGAGGRAVAARWVLEHRIELDVDLGSAVAIPGSGLTRAPGIVTTTGGSRGTGWWESISAPSAIRRS